MPCFLFSLPCCRCVPWFNLVESTRTQRVSFDFWRLLVCFACFVVPVSPSQSTGSGGLISRRNQSQSENAGKTFTGKRLRVRFDRPAATNKPNSRGGNHERHETHEREVSCWTEQEPQRTPRTRRQNRVRGSWFNHGSLGRRSLSLFVCFACFVVPAFCSRSCRLSRPRENAFAPQAREPLKRRPPWRVDDQRRSTASSTASGLIL